MQELRAHWKGFRGSPEIQKQHRNHSLPQVREREDQAKLIMNYNAKIDSILADQNGKEFQKLIAKELETITGKPVPRQQVSQWLHPDPEKRTEPRWTTGNLLFQAIDGLKEKQTIKSVVGAVESVLQDKQ